MSRIRNLALWPIENYRITSLLTVLMLAFGLYGIYMMPKDEFPPFTIRQGVIVAVMPGATSQEIEAQVARPLERYLFTFKEVNRLKTTTTSTNGMCMVNLQLQDDVRNKDEVWSKIKHGVAAFKSSLPSGVLGLVVQDDFGDTCALLITIESAERSYRELQAYSDALADRLRSIPSVSNVRQYGEVKEQISLYIDRDRLSAYGIGPSLVMQALESEGLITMSGSVTTPAQDIPVHLAPSIRGEEEIAQRIIVTDGNGRTVRVGDIAQIRREYDMSQSYIQSNGHPALLLSLEMASGHNIIFYGQDVDKAIHTFQEESLPQDVQIRRITDLPKVVGDSVSDFLRDLLISMAIIILVMMVLFPLKSAIVAAITIPLSTFISTGIMYMAGIALNTITLACLIVVLGMIVDNSIVIIDGYLEHLGKGLSRKEAAVRSVCQYFWPMLLATICICAIFYPLILTMTGEASDVIGFFPVTITINLMVSLAVAVAVIPLLNTWLINTAPQSGRMRLTDRIQKVYVKALDWTFRHPALTLALAVILVVLTSLIYPTLKIRQFPYADRNQLAVEIFLPQGEGLERTRQVADSLRAIMARDPRVTSITSFIGCSSPRFQVSYAPQVGGKNFAQFIVNTPDNKTTLEVLNAYAPKYSYYFPEAYVRFRQMDFLNVPTYEYRFLGEDLDSLRMAAEDLMSQMRLMDEIEYVHTDFEEPRPYLEVTMNPVRSAQMGISRPMAEIQLMLSTGDVQAGSLWEGDYEVPVILKNQNRDSLTMSGIADTYLNTLTGKSVPLRQVAVVAPQWSEAKILHRGGQRCISVTAEGKRGVIATPVQKRIGKIIRNMKLPEGVWAQEGGEVEKNGEMVPQIMTGMGIAVVIIFFFILFNFKRFKITILAMLAIGLSIPGAMIGLGLANRTLGLTSMFGFITLMGIIMRNEILIFEHADERMRQGWSTRDAAYDAGKRRMVPIFLTTATTAVGVIPMILAGSSFWMPVGITILAGGIGTLILVVTVLPVAYWKLNERKTTQNEK